MRDATLSDAATQYNRAPVLQTVQKRNLHSIDSATRFAKRYKDLHNINSTKIYYFVLIISTVNFPEEKIYGNFICILCNKLQLEIESFC